MKIEAKIEAKIVRAHKEWSMSIKGAKWLIDELSTLRPAIAVAGGGQREDDDAYLLIVFAEPEEK